MVHGEEVRVLARLREDIRELPGARVVLLGELELRPAVLAAEGAVGLVRPAGLLRHVLARDPSLFGDLVGGGGIKETLALSELRVGRELVALLHLEHPRQVRIRSLAGRYDVPVDLFGVVEAVRLPLVGEYLLRVQAELRRDGLALVDDDVQIRPAVFGRLHGLVRDVHLPLAVLVHPPFLPVGGGGEDDVAVEQVRGVPVGLHHVGERLGDGGPDEGLHLRQIHVGGVGELHYLDVALQGALEHADGHALVRGFGGDVEPAGREAPGLVDLLAVRGVLDALVEREPSGQAAHQALAHGVGLSRHGERACSRPADVPGQQMEVDDVDVAVLSVERLVVPDPPEGEDAASLAAFALERGVRPDRGDPPDHGGGDARAVDDLLRAVAGHDAFAVAVEPVRVLADEGLIHGLGELLHQDVGDGVLKREVAVWADGDREAVVRVDLRVAVHRPGIARVDHHGRDVALLLGGGHAPEQHRVRAARVVAPVVDEVGVLDVGIVPRRVVASQAVDVARHGRGHAHPGVGLDAVRLEDALVEDVVQPLLLHGQLAGLVDADGVSPVLLHDPDDHVGDDLHALFPRADAEDVLIEAPFRLRDVPGQRVGHVLADQDLLQPVDVEGLRGREALDALQAQVDGGVLVRDARHDLLVLDDVVGVAPHTAVRALRGHQLPRVLGAFGIRDELEQFLVACQGPAHGESGGQRGGSLEKLAAVELRHHLSLHGSTGPESRFSQVRM